MPALANPRHEAVAHALLAQMGKPMGERSQGRAYVAAGYACKDVGKTGGSAEAAASRLLKTVKPILARVAELQERERKRTNTTITDIVDELDEARALALSIEQPSAAVAATSTKAKVLGLQIDRIELGRKGEFSSATSPQDLANRMIMQASNGRIQDIAAIDEQARNAALASMSRHVQALAEIVDRLAFEQAKPLVRSGTRALSP